ncbi:MAG TPA: gamma-glutamylcyclotransferase family protein [Thermoanaerobaculia bacterium]|nr:gamma-glutamylcyclotransferase family protein [Thermoanaerobaculia bacterium]
MSPLLEVALWRILDPEVFQELDEYERPVCVRVSRTVTLDGAGPLTAWVYLYARPTAGLLPIPSGDWRAFIQLT